MAFLPHLAFVTFINLLIFHGYSEVIYEEGYSVKTVFDGNKFQINLHSVAPRPQFHDLLLLDSSNSLFYTLSLPLSQESLVKKFSGNGVSKAYYSDGDANSATFDKPKSFTIDFKGNVYVADRNNHVVRKITRSGVTTIVGDYSNSPGRVDGPGQNATFSSDYELSFVPDICALLIMDHGNNLIRQVNLKQKDCVDSRSGSVGSTTAWFVVLAVSCLVSLVIGFAARPYIIRTEAFKCLNSKSWTTYLMNLGRQAQMYCFDTRSAAVSPTLRFLKQLIMLLFSHLSLMFSFRPNRANRSSSSVCEEYVSLLDSDNSSNTECIMSQKYAEQMKELMTPNGDLGHSNMINDILKHEDVGERGLHHGKLDTLMTTNMESFGQDSSAVHGKAFLGVSTVVKRR